MKMQNSIGKKPAARAVSRRASRSNTIDLPRMFLFLELFVDKDIHQRSGK
jgi:hypothetical protein